MEPTGFALHNAIVKQTVGSSEHHFVLEDLLSRVATQVQFSNLRQGLDENGKPLGQHSDTDYAYRVEELADYLRLYANYAWVADSDNPDNDLPMGRVEEIALQLVTNDNHSLKLEPVRMISLRGCESVERERKIVAAAKELSPTLSIFQRLNVALCHATDIKSRRRCY